MGGNGTGAMNPCILSRTQPQITASLPPTAQTIHTGPGNRGFAVVTTSPNARCLQLRVSHGGWTTPLQGQTPRSQ